MTVEILLLIDSVALIVGLVILYNFLRDLRSLELPRIHNALNQLNETMKKIPQSSQFAFPGFERDTHMHEGPPPDPEKFIIWQWRDENWVAVEFPKAANLNSPPDTCGKFEGDSVRTRISD